MKNKFLYTIIAASMTFGAYAQKSDGSTKSLVKAESEFAERFAKSGSKAAYASFAAADGLVFRPNPVNARTFYAGQPDSKEVSWTPVYAKVSRSGDWGFTTGPYSVKGDQPSYGQFLSIWKVVDGKWQLAMDLGTTTNKPLNQVTPEFIEPKDSYKPKFLNDKVRAAGADIVATTEKTLNTTLKSYGTAAFSGFLNPDARLLFPGYEPIIGKDKIVPFFHGMISKISLKTTKVNKADGGDLAYSYGIATIDYKADLRESFNYIFIYERQPDHNWNIIVQAFTPADR
ncbi:hypothetical protein SAMN04488101_102180 [Pedobacter nyackensis]|uniref:DUF4440 domain-containing protein n=2 Tax=Pedobacter nyackensis TaxID=475255 RepID=A0A1W2B6J2_9SPHI|nr:hypothetical protein SAMN04488101_102180 [Pedobacter nyackensis]